MKNGKLVLFSLKVLVADMVLNWILGFVLTLLPRRFEKIMSTSQLLPLWGWWVIGIGFLLFAAWQVGVIRRGQIRPKELVFAGVMAWIPMLLVIIVLLLDLPLRQWVRAVLWLANGYMFMLGGLYLFLFHRISKYEIGRGFNDS